MLKSRRNGYISLIGCILGIWILSSYILPFITDSFETTRKLANHIDESGIETSQFFYTGVESTAKAESGARASLAFWEMKRSAHKKEEKSFDK